MTNTILLFIAGLVILILGADLLVRGASRLAAAFGVSPLVIGLTIVAIGTASPEIAVSVQAAANGQGDLTLGNVLGSNIFNILFIKIIRFELRSKNRFVSHTNSIFII